MSNVQSISYNSDNSYFEVELTGPADSSYHTGTGQVLDYNFPYILSYPFAPTFSNGVLLDPVGSDGLTVDTGKIFIPTGTTTFTFTVPINFGSPYGSRINIYGTIDTVLFSKLFTQATLYTAEKTTVIPAEGGSVTTTDIEFDYSSHFDRMISATEQLNSTIDSKINQLNSTVDNQLTLLNAKIEDLNSKIETIKTLAEGDGLHILGPWEWLGQVGIIQYLEEKELDLAELKAKVEALPKSFTPPGGGS